MTKHLRRDLTQLERAILRRSGLVEELIRDASLALVERRADLAHSVLERESSLRQQEDAIESECLKVLALHQPVASDLRFVVAVVKVNKDLERMGDLAIHVAERACDLARREPLPVALRFPRMVDLTRGMVRDALDSLVRQDSALARAVRARDDQVDAINRWHLDALEDLMKEDSSRIEGAVDTISASRQLERIADLATSVAEDVIFMVDGEPEASSRVEPPRPEPFRIRRGA